MKVGMGGFKASFWLPVFIIGSIFFLLASVYLGYQLTQNSKKDTENIREIKEFQSVSKSALFFSRKIAAGDPVAIEALSSTIESMDDRVNLLLEADDYTKDELSTEFEATVNYWRSIKSNSAIMSEVEASINLLNASSEKLDDSASTAQKIINGTVEDLVKRGASNIQINALHKQETLLREMAQHLGGFSTEVQPSSKSFDLYRASLANFDKNHRALLNGDVTTNLRGLSDTGSRNKVIAISNLVEGVRTAEPYIINSVEAMLLARDAQEKIISSFEGLQFTLDDLSVGIEGLGAKRFPQLYHILITLLCFVLCLIFTIYFTRQTSQDLIEREHEENESTQAAILRLLDELADLADGDLTVTTTVSEDFTGAIADSVNYTIDQLRQLVSRINSTAVQVSGAAQESQQTALHLAEASDHQAQEIAGASAAINEMAVTIDQVSANAAESALVASKSVSIANNGAKLVQNTIHGMDTIREQIQDTSKRIKRLGESSQEIGDIVSLINDIADQTNILALNAAIQASMAGDAGRGFAVVADEVQRLAERSAAATKQIESLVKTIQTDTNEAVISMEQTTTEVVGGARLAQDAGVALEEIEGVSANLAELIQNISNAARQQASSAGHISNTMNVIQEITSQTSAGTGATAQSIGELADMALELRESVAGFKLPDGMSPDADVDMDIALDSDSWLSADDMEADNSFSGGSDAQEKAAEFGVSEDVIKDAEKDLEELFASDETFDEDDGFDLADADDFDFSDLDFIDDTKDSGK